MRLFRPLLSNVRRLGPRLSYTDRFLDRDTQRIDKRARYVASPLPFQEDPLLRKSRYRGTWDEETTRTQYDTKEATDSRVRTTKEFEPIPYDVTPENRFELINRVMCPLHVITYENQLKMKYTGMKNVLSEFGRRIRGSGQSPVVLDSQQLPCPVQFTKKSPKIVAYRNKDEFSIWPGIDGNPKTVGFFIGEPSRHSNVVCVEPDQLIITKDSHKKISSQFQTYLREVSPLEVCLNFSEGGNWRRFVIRSNEASEHMIVAQLHPQDLSSEDLEEEKDRLRNYFQKISGDLNIKSAFLQCLKTSSDRATNEGNLYHLLFGDACINETVLGSTFSISPESFFQTNVLAAEVLYMTVMEELAVKKDMTVIDLCCGTGTLSVLLAPHVRRVIGIELSSQAVEDAKRNAKMNGVRNVHFIQGAAEDIMPNLKEELFGQKIVMVANPGRAGLRSSVITAIRAMESVSKLVYIACKPAGDAMKNFFHLAINPTRYDTGSPMLPINATPVDMFPQTDHVELVMTFERFS